MRDISDFYRLIKKYPYIIPLVIIVVILGMSLIESGHNNSGQIIYEEGLRLPRTGLAIIYDLSGSSPVVFAKRNVSFNSAFTKANNAILEFVCQGKSLDPIVWWINSSPQKKNYDTVIFVKAGLPKEKNPFYEVSILDKNDLTEGINSRLPYSIDDFRYPYTYLNLAKAQAIETFKNLQFEHADALLITDEQEDYIIVQTPEWEQYVLKYFVDYKGGEIFRAVYKDCDNLKIILTSLY